MLRLGLGECMFETKERAEENEENPLEGSVFVDIVRKRSNEEGAGEKCKNDGEVAVWLGERKESADFSTDESEVETKEREPDPSALDEKFYKIIV